MVDASNCSKLKLIKLSVVQTVISQDNIKLEYFESEAEFCNSATKSAEDEYDTSKYHCKEKASMGACNIIEVDDD